jgi:hypothetical protein
MRGSVVVEQRDLPAVWHGLSIARHGDRLIMSPWEYGHLRAAVRVERCVRSGGLARLAFAY